MNFVRKLSVLVYRVGMLGVAVSILTFYPEDSSLTAFYSDGKVQNWLGEPGAFCAAVVFLLFGQVAYVWALCILLVQGYELFVKRAVIQFQLKRFCGILCAVLLYGYIVVVWTGNQGFDGGGLIAAFLLKISNVLGGGIGVLGSALLLLVAVGYALSSFTVSGVFRRVLSMRTKHNRKPPLFEKLMPQNSAHETFQYAFLSNIFTQELLLKLQKKRMQKIFDNSMKQEQALNQSSSYTSATQAENALIVRKEASLATTTATAPTTQDPTVTSESPEGEEQKSLQPAQYLTQVHMYINYYNTNTTNIEAYPASEVIHQEESVFEQAEIEQGSLSLHRHTNPLSTEQTKEDHSTPGETLHTTDLNSQVIKAQFEHFTCSSAPQENSQTESTTAQTLQKTLEEFHIDATITDMTRGPVITCYEVELAKGVRVNKLINLQDNLALALGTSSIRLITPIPGKSAVGIEIPNTQRDFLRFGDIIQQKALDNCKYTLPLLLGQGMSGKTRISDLTHLPHLLIAGATGMGKSVFLNSLIAGLLYTKTPSHLRFIMIDPKRVELKTYDNIPYLLTPVITDPKKALTALKWATSEMERRYDLLEEYKCRNISNYHNKIKGQSGIKKENCLEYIVIIIDEFADLILVSGREVEEQIARLAAMSRAVGIHLIIATQRPSADIITGLIKANFPARVAFQVSSKMESRIILDLNGAEKLLGRGDLLFTGPAMMHVERIQGAYSTENEIHELSTKIQHLAPPHYTELREDTQDKDYGIEDDTLYHEAIETILLERRASASYLQRKMKIGYNRAARLIEMMEYKGIISEANGSKPREILIEHYTKP